MKRQTRLIGLSSHYSRLPGLPRGDDPEEAQGLPWTKLVQTLPAVHIVQCVAAAHRRVAAPF
jgi:hypothetical protein